MNERIVNILGCVIVLSMVSATALVVLGRNVEAAIAGLISIGSSAVGQLGGVLQASPRPKAQKDDEPTP